jgi:abortive infection bacteriophage resistance protein
MASKPARTIADQIALLQSRGMLFRDIDQAPHFLQNISYYRLKGYWWDMQADKTTHQFLPDSYFEDAVDRYNFDRHLRLILFDAVERIEIALRAQMIYHLSMAHGPLWYLDSSLFPNTVLHSKNVTSLIREFGYSQEIFIIDHKNRYPNDDPEAWKIMEIASMGTLSKFYKTLRHSLPAKALIAKGMGLNLHKELASWLEAIVYVRNIIAHHSRLWSRDMVKRPTLKINNPKGKWLNRPLKDAQKQKAFLIISCMLYLCNKVTPNHQIKTKIKDLIQQNPHIPVYKLGFFDDWELQDLWK